MSKKLLKSLVSACLEQVEKIVAELVNGVKDLESLNLELLRAIKSLKELSYLKALTLEGGLAVKTAWKLASISDEIRIQCLYGRSDRAKTALLMARYLASETIRWCDGRPLIDLGVNLEDWWASRELRQRLHDVLRASEDGLPERILPLMTGWPVINFELPIVLEELVALHWRGEGESSTAKRINDALKAAYISVG